MGRNSSGSAFGAVLPMTLTCYGLCLITARTAAWPVSPIFLVLGTFSAAIGIYADYQDSKRK